MYKVHVMCLNVILLSMGRLPHQKSSQNLKSEHTIMAIIFEILMK